jgi:molybdopterin molybdotransferase
VISVREADIILRGAVRPFGVEACALDAAAGRILREEVRADRPLPPYDRVAMDGVALSAAAVDSGVRTFRVQATQRAGELPVTLAATDACIEVMTGAVLPAGTDCVVRVEDLLVEPGTVTLAPAATAVAAGNVHGCGSDRAAGAVLIEPGVRLDATHAGIAASVGRATLQVSVRPRIALVSTGNELVPVDAAPLSHQVRASNMHAVSAALAEAGFAVATACHFRDSEAPLAAGLAALLEEHDVLVLSGGVSVGRFDLVPAVLARLGVERHIHRVLQKPGKPLLFGTADAGAKLVFGLPGNPVSALVCACRYVLPTLRHASGLREGPVAEAVLATDVPARAGLTLFVPVALRWAGGRRLATPVPLNGSGDFSALAATDGFVEVDDAGAAGTAVPCHPWR